MDSEQFNRMMLGTGPGTGADVAPGMLPNLSRRGFIKVASGAAGGLVLGLSMGAPGEAQAQSAGPPPRPFAPGAQSADLRLRRSSDPDPWHQARSGCRKTG
jgi:hypothetical protein